MLLQLVCKNKTVFNRNAVVLKRMPKERGRRVAVYVLFKRHFIIFRIRQTLAQKVFKRALMRLLAVNQNGVRKYHRVRLVRLAVTLNRRVAVPQRAYAARKVSARRKAAYRNLVGIDSPFVRVCTHELYRLRHVL